MLCENMRRIPPISKVFENVTDELKLIEQVLS